VDRLDIVYLHDPDDHVADALATGYPTLAGLRAEGLVRAIGAGMNDAAPLATLVREADLDVVMLAGRYTLLEQQSLDQLMPLCEARGVGVVVAGVFNSGLLARPSPTPGARYDYADASPELLERARAIAIVCERYGTTLPAVALAFPAAHPAVVSVCVGARSANQIERNAALSDEPIPAAVWAELKAKGLLREDAPVPGAEDDRP
jgi:D-threo-aldose 1-dehydrogenase